MEYRPLGKSGLNVSTISIGCWPIVGDAVWGPQDKSESIAALMAAFEHGINFFDSAEMYGNGYSEELLGEAFERMRGSVIIASKVWPTHLAKDDLRAACEASLRRLRTDYIDVYYIHWPSRSVPLQESIETLRRLRQEGKIRVIGCSNYGVADLAEISQLEPIAVNELPYNLLWRAIEYEIMPACLQHGVSVAAYMPLMQGLLAGKFGSADDVPEMRARTRHFSPKRAKIRHPEAGAEEETFAAINKIRLICDAAGLPMAQVSLAWLLHQANIASVIAGVRNPEQVRSNASAASLVLPPSMLQALDEATRPLKEKMGSNADMWETPSRFR